MKATRFLWPAGSFLTGLVLSWAAIAGRSHSTAEAGSELRPGASRQPALTPSATAPPGQSHRKAPAVPATSPVPDREENLLQQCRDLCATDPAAAFRDGMARWGFDLSSLSAAAEALVKNDLEAARRLLAECPDLRSKTVLQAALMADEVSHDPLTKLRWAEANLQGHVKTKALYAGLAALAATDPDGAMEILAEWPASYARLHGVSKAIASKMQQDPAAALAWIKENVDPGKQEMTGVLAALNYRKANPGAGPEIVASLPPELRKSMVMALGSRDKSLAQIISDVQALPLENQDLAIRGAVANLRAADLQQQKDPGPTEAGFLASISNPQWRASAIEALAAQRLTVFEAESTQAETLEWLSKLETPADKQAAARVVPHIFSLTPDQKTELLKRLE